MERIPTALTAREAQLVRQYSSGCRLLEAGTLFGYTAFYAARHGALVTTVDRHEGYPAACPAPTSRAFLRNLARCPWRERITAVVGDIRTVALPPHDVAFVDLTGEYDLTSAVLQRLRETPTVLVHDFGRNGCAGVAQAVLEQAARIETVVDTTVVLRRVV